MNTTWNPLATLVDLKFYWLVSTLDHFSNYAVAYRNHDPGLIAPDGSHCPRAGSIRPWATGDGRGAWAQLKSLH